MGRAGDLNRLTNYLLLESASMQIKHSGLIPNVLCSSAAFMAAVFFGLALTRASAQWPVKVEHDLTIPNGRTAWAVDAYDGQPQLVPVHHSTVIINQHKGQNFAGSMIGSFLYRPKITTELDGLHSRNQLHTPTPIFYVLDPASEDPGGDATNSDTHTYVVSRVGIIKNKRIVDYLSYNELTGNAKREEQVIPATTTVTADGWIRIEPKKAMKPGEYCILPVPKASGTYATTVYDFGIDFHAPNEQDAIAAKGN